MKKRYKVLFALVVMFVLCGVVFASTYVVDKTGTLANTVNGNSTSRNTIEGTGKFGSDAFAYIEGIKNVTGSNASGGIRVKTFAKKLILGVVIDSQEDQIDVFSGDSKSNTVIFYLGPSKTNNVKMQWQNWTGNTSFNGRFIAYTNSL